MNYRHSFHAGNFADVVKHVALIQILLHLQKKETPFVVIDSHAGRGLYDLGSDEAQRTGEAQNGIEAIRDLSGPEALNIYLAMQAGNHYAGSPLIAAKMLRPHDRLLAIEKNPAEATLLRETLSVFRKARVEEGDGYARLIAALPPQERRGLVLMDPPFEAPDEFQTAAETVRGAVRRFATGIALIWYPVKSPAAARAFCGEVLTSGAAKIFNIEMSIDAPEGKLASAGLLVLNPPFGFDVVMGEILDKIAPCLPGGRARLEWLRGEA